MSYTKTTWAFGDPITSEKMNNLENGVYSNDAALANKASASHKGTHSIGGTDVLSPADIGAMSTSDIVNDTTTGGTSKALSAEQGKMLNTNKAEKTKMFYPDNVYGGIITTNFNTISVSGSYTGFGTATGAPTTAQSWFIRHINSNSGTTTAYQEGIGYTDGAFYTRHKRSGVWDAWTLQPDGASLQTEINEKTGYGVYSGLAVTAQSTPNMTVSVPGGVIYMNTGRRFTPVANTALAINAADATNPRIDIVYVNSSGVISYLAGTAAASPVAPNVPTGGQKLSEISVAAGATTITNATIADWRKTLTGEAWITPTLTNGWTQTDAINYPVGYYKDSMGVVHLRGLIKAGTYNTVALVLPSGYRPAKHVFFTTRSVDAFACGYATNGGNVVPSSIAYSSNVSLDGISFRAEA